MISFELIFMTSVLVEVLQKTRIEKKLLTSDVILLVRGF